MRILIALIIIQGYFFSPLIKADSHDGLLRCAQINIPDERLKCFDLLVEQHKKKVTHHSQSSSEDSFGLPRKKASDVTTLTSNIVGPFKGWVKGKIIQLKNGQRWRVTSRTRGYIKLDSPVATISEGLFGSFNMKVTGFSPKAKVKRIK